MTAKILLFSYLFSVLSRIYFAAGTDFECHCLLLIHIE